MSEISKEDLKEVLDDALKGMGWVEQQTHEEHHDFVKSLIEKRKQETWEKVKQHVLGWGIVAILGALGAWALDHITFR